MTAVDEVPVSLPDVPPPHLSDDAWLQTLSFRKSAPQALRDAAGAGEVEPFSGRLGQSLDLLQGMKNSDRRQVLAQLPLLWDLPGDVCCADALTLADCLFHDDPDVVCACVESVMASHVDAPPEQEILIAACWLMLVRRRDLAPETLFPLWRWTLQSARFGEQSMPASRRIGPDGEPDPGHVWYHRFRVLELELLTGSVAAELKGVKKQARFTIDGLRETLEEATDTDGTPVAAMLPDLLASLSSLARVTLLERLLEHRGRFGPHASALISKNRPLWTKLNRARLEGLFERAASLVTPWHLAFTRLPDETPATERDQGGVEHVPVPLVREFGAIGTAIGLPGKSGLVKLFREWDRETGTGESSPAAKRKKRRSQWRLPEECHQSDWAEWGCLRSGWASPIDQVVLAHDGTLPMVDVVVRNLPLFTGTWAHQLVIDGTPAPAPEGWSCVCWFDDEEAAFMELQADLDAKTRLIRQACLVREEQILLLADAVHSRQAERIEYERSLPLCGHWFPEQDTRTRELALLDAGEWRIGRGEGGILEEGKRGRGEEGRGGERRTVNPPLGPSAPRPLSPSEPQPLGSAAEPLRVRLFPLTAPQERVVRSEESTTIAQGRLVTRRSAEASQTCLATLFDWSEKRREAPVDWSALTVAEDGAILPASVAAAFRIRIGKQQWFWYHSLIPPRVPRTALGLHTANETVFGRLTRDGDVTPIVEVEGNLQS
jgi:hypothetical protein